nr:hypothetical protein [Tanacetum cinerariifolium]
MQTQTSNTLHNAIMEAGSKDRPPMLAPGNYIQWKSKIKRYIDTKHNHELIHYCLTNAPYELGWIDKEIPISEGSPITRIERFQETYKNVLFYKMISCRNKCEVTNHQVNVQFLLYLKPEWQRQHQNKVNEVRAKRLARNANSLALVVATQPPVYHPQPKPTHYNQSSSTRSQVATINKGEEIANTHSLTYDSKPKAVSDEKATPRDKEIEKLMALISMSFKKIYKPTNNNLRTSSNTRNKNVDNIPRSDRRIGYDRQTRQYENQRAVNVAGAKDNARTQVMQQTVI